MSNRSIKLSDALYDYLLAHSLREPEVMRRLREETAALPHAAMQIAPEQGQFMALLVRLMGARRCIEIGTYTGYSALAVAQVLPPDGIVVACDVNPETTAIGKRYWQEAGVAAKIDLRLGPAVETLNGMLAAGEKNGYDFVFIDANKADYDSYYELALQLLRPGGLIAVDNVLWDAAVVDDTKQDIDTKAIRALNDKISDDQRVFCSMLPLGDGLTLAYKQNDYD